HRRRDDGRRQRLDSDAAAGDRAADVRRVRRRTRCVLRAFRQPGRPGWRGARGPAAIAGRGPWLPNPAQARFNYARSYAEGRGEPGDLRGPRRRRTVDQRTGGRAAAGATVLSVLAECGPRNAEYGI